MQRTVTANRKRKIYRGKDIRTIIAKVEKTHPQISNWSVKHYQGKTGRYLHGDSRDGTFVTIPNV